MHTAEGFREAAAGTTQRVEVDREQLEAAQVGN
jgi:hypothetical protein